MRFETLVFKYFKFIYTKTTIDMVTVRGNANNLETIDEMFWESNGSYKYFKSLTKTAL